MIILYFKGNNLDLKIELFYEFLVVCVWYDLVVLMVLYCIISIFYLIFYLINL